MSNDKKKYNSTYVPRGVDVPALDHDKLWHFVPDTVFQVGDPVSGGNIIGHVEDKENELIEHKIMVPPDVSGNIVERWGEDEYNLDVSASIRWCLSCVLCCINTFLFTPPLNSHLTITPTALHNGGP